MTNTASTFRHSIFVIACLLLGLLATTGSQCARVEDPAKAGLDIQAVVNSCIQECNAQARAAREAEQTLHASNVAACLSIPPGDERAACLEAEDERHDARMDEIAAEQDACKEGCHDQGRVSVGE